MLRGREASRLRLDSQRMFSDSTVLTRLGMTRTAFARSRRGGESATALVALLLVLAGCGGAASGSSSAGHGAASAGVCHAMAALPDVTDSQRAFNNEAHEALHALAADPRLDRTIAARVLESMQRVEADFAQAAGPDALGIDLSTLLEAADDGLAEVGQAVPACS